MNKNQLLSPANSQIFKSGNEHDDSKTYYSKIGTIREETQENLLFETQQEEEESNIISEATNREQVPPVPSTEMELF